MKTTFNVAVVSFVLLAGSTFMSAATAADGKINFTGSIEDAACTITPGSAIQTKNLGNISKAGFAAVGDTSSAVKFDIILNTCPASALTATIKFDGPTDGTNSDLLALADVADVATGVGIALYESDSSTLIPIGSDSASKPLDPAGDTTFTYIAKYMATNLTVDSGPANAAVDFTVNYN